MDSAPLEPHTCADCQTLNFLLLTSPILTSRNPTPPLLLHACPRRADIYDSLEEPTDEEYDMLDLAFGLTETYVTRGRLESGAGNGLTVKGEQWT